MSDAAARTMSGSWTGGAKENCAGRWDVRSHLGRCMEMGGLVLRLEAKLNYTCGFTWRMSSYFYCPALGSCRGYAEKAA